MRSFLTFRSHHEKEGHLYKYVVVIWIEIELLGCTGYREGEDLRMGSAVDEIAMPIEAVHLILTQSHDESVTRNSQFTPRLGARALKELLRPHVRPQRP
jgi:hypothetical protein